MDGEHGFAAGNLGFEAPAGGERAEVYRKLYQVSWTRKMTAKGHFGIHVTSGAVEFVSSYVAPIVLAESWNRDWLIRLIEEAKAPAPATQPAP